MRTGAAAPVQRTAEVSTVEPDNGLAALLHAVIEVPPRPAPISRRPVICVRAIVREQPPPAQAELREQAYQAAGGALSQLAARPAKPGAAERATVRGLLTAAIAEWRTTQRVPAAFPTFDTVCRALDAEPPPAHQARGLLLGGRPEGLKEFGGWLGLVGTVLSLSQTPWAAPFARVMAGVGYLALTGVVVALAWTVLPKLRTAWRLLLAWRATGSGGWWMWNHVSKWHPALAGPDVADQLLGYAVLHDLRRAYRRPFRLGGWPTSCPVLLLPGQAATGPLDVLIEAQLTTARSPLVLVVAGMVDGAAGQPAHEPTWWLNRVDDRPGRLPAEPAVWRVEVPAARPTPGAALGGGFAPGPVPGGGTAAEPVSGSASAAGPVSGGVFAPEPAPGGASAPGRVSGGASAVDLVPGGASAAGPVLGGASVAGPPRQRSRRWWEGPYAHWSAVAGLTVAGLVAAVAFVVLDAAVPACPLGESTEPASDGQLIGYRLCGQPIADPDKGAVADRLREFQQDIFDENKRADRLARGGSRRVLTMVAITSSTTRGDGASVMAEAEGLAGVYAAQYRINHGKGDHPLLKVAVANAGAGGDHLGPLVKNHLKPLFTRRGDPVLGGVITVNSTQTVKQALGELKDQPVTLLTPTMTADGIGAGVPGFFMMITPNAQQAKLVVDYVRKVYPGRSLIDFYRAPAAGPAQAHRDLYVESLTKHLALAAVATGRSASRVRLQVRPWPLYGSLRGYCTSRNVLFFGGRYLDFGPFLQQLSNDCPGRTPPVIADDSSSRLLSDRTGQQDLPADVPIALATKSIPLYCARLALPGFANATDTALPDPPRAAFRESIRDALGRCDPKRENRIDDAAGLAGGWAAGSYDATRVTYWALSAAQRPGQTPDQIAQDVRGMLRRGPIPFGVNSPITFNAERAAADGRISLYCLQDPSIAFADDSSAANKVTEVMREGRSYRADGRAPAPSPCRSAGR